MRKIALFWGILLAVILLVVNYTCGNKSDTRYNPNIEKQDKVRMEVPHTQKKSITDEIKLVEYKTGFYSDGVQGSPIVIMKWKNGSDKSINDDFRIEGVFIDNKKGEELSRSSDYIQLRNDILLQPGLSKQLYFKCRYVYMNFVEDGIKFARADVSCQIYINKQLYKTIKIENKELYSVSI